MCAYTTVEPAFIFAAPILVDGVVFVKPKPDTETPHYFSEGIGPGRVQAWCLMLVQGDCILTRSLHSYCPTPTYELLLVWRLDMHNTLYCKVIYFANTCIQRTRSCLLVQCCEYLLLHYVDRRCCSTSPESMSSFAALGPELVPFCPKDPLRVMLDLFV